MSYNYSEHNAIWDEGGWFDRLDRRCQFSGRKLGTVERRYHPWARHHTSSDAYDDDKGRLRPGWNYLLLSKRSHWFVHFLGGQLFLRGNSIRSQNYWARRLPLTWVWKYPNLLQRAFHSWCRLPHVVKDLVRFAIQVLLIAVFFVLCSFFVVVYLKTGMNPVEVVRYIFFGA